MRIVVAPDSFKESMTAEQAANAMEKGIKNVCEACTVVKVPMADGGEGTASLLMKRLGAKSIKTNVTGPLGKTITAEYGITDKKTALMDVASVVGMNYVQPHERNPLETTTYGIGELIIDALNRGAKDFIIGLGGSSTNDGGIGMAQALGIQINDKNGDAVAPNGSGLEQIAEIDMEKLDERLRIATFTIISDVDNVLTGPNGTTYIYSRQKGADDSMLKKLERGMVHYASIIKKDLQVDAINVPGVGAAGGLGMAFIVFLQAKIKSGINYMMELIGLEDEIKQAQLVLTGEGKIDDQTLHGKVPIGVASLAKKHNVPVVAIAGMNHVAREDIYQKGIDAVFSIINEPMDLSAALQHAEYLAEKTTENVFRLFLQDK